MPKSRKREHINTELLGIAACSCCVAPLEFNPLYTSHCNIISDKLLRQERYFPPPKQLRRIIKCIKLSTILSNLKTLSKMREAQLLLTQIFILFYLLPKALSETWGVFSVVPGPLGWLLAGFWFCFFYFIF